MVFGICGYGNLGKAVEKELIKNNQKNNLFGIFSRRDHLSSPYKTKFYSYEHTHLYKDKIDVMIMCGGSKSDLLWQSPKMLENFNIIDTFDTHEMILNHKDNLEKISKQSGKTAIYSCGWDPGIFSLIRVLSANIFKSSPQTFWGKGVSQGHSQALRNIPGIADAVQFTIPNKTLYNQVKKDPSIKLDPNQKHERHCYISLSGERSFEEIKNDILNTSYYFKDQKVFIYEISSEEVKKLKKKMLHKGSVFGGEKNTCLNFNVKMKNNPEFTAKIVLAYATCIKSLSPGVYSVLDIPLSSFKSTNYL